MNNLIVFFFFSPIGLIDAQGIHLEGRRRKKFHPRRGLLILQASFAPFEESLKNFLAQGTISHPS
jgi:hypothetical protein